MLTTIFYHTDNFCKDLEKMLQGQPVIGLRRRGPERCLFHSEIMTILIYFHHSGMKNFKEYCHKFVLFFGRRAFPKAPSYNRYIEMVPSVLPMLNLFLELSRLGSPTKVSFIDSTPLVVCKNARIKRNKVFAGSARLSRNSMGWFYGFKLHVVINELGEIVAFTLSRANTDDRNEKVIDHLTEGLQGKLIGDRGYISKNLLIVLQIGA